MAQNNQFSIITRLLLFSLWLVSGVVRAGGIEAVYYQDNHLENLIGKTVHKQIDFRVFLPKSTQLSVALLQLLLLLFFPSLVNQNQGLMIKQEDFQKAENKVSG